jgi:dolichyl-diphosphooligosaccharide--protein glycosyltransferase
MFLGIVGLAIYVRSGTLNAKTILDYDPWWYYRHAQDIMNNGMIPPKWDLLSYYPPGRPFDKQLGWEYTLILFYKLASVIKPAITFFELSKWAPLIMVSLGAIPAFYLGRFLSNKWGGLITALFAVLAPTFIGVSLAAYIDNDPVVVFYMYFSILSIVLALTKTNGKFLSSKSLLFVLFAILVNSLFIFTWGGGWLVLLLFTAFIPTLFIFRILESIVHTKSLKVTLPIQEIKSYIIPLVIIILAVNAFALVMGLDDMLKSVSVLLGFVNPGQGLLVNISVAELQPINIFTSDGFSSVAGRVGLGSFILTLVGLPLLVIFKLWKKTKINFFEIFMFLWIAATFYMILHGVRFSLLFSTASAVAAGYVIGNAVQLFKKDVIGVSFFGIILVLVLMFISDAMVIGAQSSGGFDISDNWINALTWLKQNADKNSLISTWWDPGHIITGMTGLKVHADGAHCDPVGCYPYNHNIRIQDMGRIFSTTDENESVSILKKYMSLTPQQCQEVKNRYGSAVPANACDPVTEQYLIASNDLIGKFHWMSFFGLGTARDYIQLSLNNYDQQNGILSYLNGEITLVRKNDTWVPVYNNKYVIKELVYFDNNQMKYIKSNSTDAIDGMVWAQSDYRAIIFMPPEVRNSIFTKLYFFDGEGLSHFKLVYGNSELKIFKIIF